MNRNAFTLVELLIVVAIISILSTVGVPLFRKMQQKARKVEAKSALGSIYQVESAFHSEFGVYTNVINKIGYSPSNEIGNTGTTAGRYIVGFPLGGPGACRGCVGNRPSLPTWVNRIIQQKPTFFSDAPVYCVFYPTGLTLGGFCDPGDVDEVANTFLATASGAIAPGVDHQLGGSPGF